MRRLDFAHPVAQVRGVTRRRSEGSEDGFTLVEMVIVIAIMPIVVGAIAVGIISVLSLQTSVSNRLSDSADAEVVSVHFQNDVESAQAITTASVPQSAPTACGSGFQVLGLQLGNGTVISYSTVAAGPNAATLWRYVCTGGTLTSSLALAHDLPPSTLSTSPVTVTCPTSPTPPACQTVGSTNTPAYQLNWVSPLDITAVTFQTTEPGSGYTYLETAVPVASTNSSNLTSVGSQSTGCGFATPGTGLSTLCFVNFAPWDAITSSGPPSNPNCGSGQLYMSAGIENTAYILSFCMQVTSAEYNSNCGQGCSGTPISGYVSQANNGCGVANRAGWDDIDAVPLPTYACPPTSEAFLGNNGFYTGVTGDPGLYTVEESSTAVISFTNIKVLTAGGSVATNWKLATGDAESTDASESITWQSNEDLFLIPNSANSPIGNACMSFGQYAPPTYNTNYLTGIGTTKVECSSTVSADHTGTTMLYATTPSSLTVTLVGSGLQAMFFGVELS
jgi:prepilin-type N-terminal cleavage/methylation domain-containing protein